MKKILTVLFLIISANFLSAELIVDIPFNPDQVGPAYSTQGNYVYEGETFYVTNTAVTDTFYLNLYAYEMPAPWNMFWCHEGTCSYLGWGPWYVVLEENVEYDIHANIEVYDMAGGFNYQFVFDHETFVDSVVIDFSFYTEDATSAENDLISESIILLQNYPNPFNPETTISFSLNTENTELIIYNIKGQQIRQYSVFNNQSSIIWNGTDENGNTVPSGMYFYKLISEGNSGRYTSTKKMILMK